MTGECKTVGMALACSFLAVGILTAKCSSPSIAMPQTKDASDLVATIQVTSQSYCALDKPAGIAFFEVHVRIDNRSQTRAIISKKYLDIDPELRPDRSRWAFRRSSVEHHQGRLWVLRPKSPQKL